MRTVQATGQPRDLTMAQALRVKGGSSRTVSLLLPVARLPGDAFNGILGLSRGRFVFQHRMERSPMSPTKRCFGIIS